MKQTVLAFILLFLFTSCFSQPKKKDDKNENKKTEKTKLEVSNENSIIDTTTTLVKIISYTQGDEGTEYLSSENGYLVVISQITKVTKLNSKEDLKSIVLDKNNELVLRKVVSQKLYNKNNKELSLDGVYDIKEFKWK